MKQLLLSGVLIFPTAANTQPFSESMAECAALYQNAAQWVNTDESADKLMFAAISWADAALIEAQSEGPSATSDAIWQLIDRKTTRWEAKGEGVFFSQDFRDWTQYCRKFAKERGMEVTP
ncbi:MAG: hypothetical protein ABJL67_00845 [Sulfitobacter sp.]